MQYRQIRKGDREIVWKGQWEYGTCWPAIVATGLPAIASTGGYLPAGYSEKISPRTRRAFAASWSARPMV
jgi:hypothetical protein